MELILFIGFIGWLIYICKRCDVVDAGRTAYERHCKNYPGVSSPSWFENNLATRERELDQNINHYEKYLAANPSPPKVPQ